MEIIDLLTFENVRKIKTKLKNLKVKELFGEVGFGTVKMDKHAVLD